MTVDEMRRVDVNVQTILISPSKEAHALMNVTRRERRRSPQTTRTEPEMLKLSFQTAVHEVEFVRHSEPELQRANTMTILPPSQAKVFTFLWNHPNTSLVLAAKELHMSYVAVRVAKCRLMKRRNIHLYCPECVRPTLRGLFCQSCGVELDTPNISVDVNFNSQSPVHTIQPLNGLGSETNYAALHLQYGGRNIAHLVEKARDPFLERCRFELWEELKGPMLRDGVVEEATRLLMKEVLEFRARYPTLTHVRGASRQLVANVVALVKLRYPNCFSETVKQECASA